MGGSGGGGYFSSDPKATMKALKASQEKAKDDQYVAQCNTLLASYLSDFNDRDLEAISRHLEEIKKALENELEGTIDLKYGGSVSKHTFINGLSDVDSLVMLDNCELSDRAPNSAKEYLLSRLKAHFPKTEMAAGQLAVTVKFGDAEIQLLPAVSCGDHVKIADETGTQWANIRPKEFSRVLSQVNQEKAGKVVPVIKLAKAIINNLPERHQVSGYHAESLAVDLFRNYKAELRTKEMLKHYFTEGAERVLRPIKDHSGQSVHVDDSLGAEYSLERRIVSDAFARIARRINNADAAGRLEDWLNLFGD
jgi:hypothetical protein